MKKEFERLDMFIRGTTNMFGVLTHKVFLKIYNKYNEKKLLKKELMELSDKLNSYKNGYHIYTNLIINTRVEERIIDKTIFYQNEKPFYFPTEEEITNFSKIDYYLKTEYTEKFKKYLIEKQNVSILAIDSLIKKIIWEITIGSETQKVFNILDSYNIEYKNYIDISEMTKLVMDLYNNTRVWSNCGYSPIETRKNFLKDNLR